MIKYDKETEVMDRLNDGEKFTGTGYAYSGIVTPRGINGRGELAVMCQNPEGTHSFEEHWDLKLTLYGFAVGEYVFLDDRDKHPDEYKVIDGKTFSKENLAKINAGEYGYVML